MTPVIGAAGGMALGGAFPGGHILGPILGAALANPIMKGIEGASGGMGALSKIYPALRSSLIPYLSASPDVKNLVSAQIGQPQNYQ